jgi:hypothetical protein
VINAERAAFRSPNFQHKFENVRKFQLQYILQGAKLPDEWGHTLLLLQQLTKCTPSLAAHCAVRGVRGVRIGLTVLAQSHANSWSTCKGNSRRPLTTAAMMATIRRPGDSG